MRQSVLIKKDKLDLELQVKRLSEVNNAFK